MDQAANYMQFYSRMYEKNMFTVYHVRGQQRKSFAETIKLYKFVEILIREYKVIVKYVVTCDSIFWLSLNTNLNGLCCTTLLKMTFPSHKYVLAFVYNPFHLKDIVFSPITFTWTSSKQERGWLQPHFTFLPVPDRSRLLKKWYLRHISNV